MKDNNEKLLEKIASETSLYLDARFQYKDFISVTFMYEGFEHKGFPYIIQYPHGNIHILTEFGDILMSEETFEKDIKDGKIYDIKRIEDLWSND